MTDVNKLIIDNIDVWTSAIKKRNSQGRGSNSKVELTGVKKLRELILELAVRGKLVPQDLKDEPASLLLEKIAEEKAQLIADKKIKNSKPLPDISDEEKPFELPHGWKWNKLGNLSSDIHYGYTASAKHNCEGVRLLRITDIQNDKVDWPTVPACDISQTKSQSYLLVNDDILIARTGGTIGKSYLVENIDLQAVFASYLIRVKRISAMYAPFIKTYLGSQLYWGQLYDNAAGTGQPNVNATALKSLAIPIPPEAEQHRIVTKVDELMALCDQLEQQTEQSLLAHQTLVEALLNTLIQSVDADDFQASWQRIADHFDVLFTTETSIDQLKQTILQLAVMGKLVPQNLSDEPASKLLEKIAEEKAQLIKDKKIKKQKPLPAITDEEKPFELPSGWGWVRFEDVVDIQGGITKGRKLAGRELIKIPYLSVANVQRSYLELGYLKEVEIPITEKEKYRVQERDLLITEGGDWDKVGRTAIWTNELPYVGHQNHVFKARIFIKEQCEVWLEKYLNGPFARNYFAGSSKQTTNLASINKTQLRSCMIAMPPNNEMKLIVTKINELMALCDQLKTRLADAQITQLHLADAVVENALN